MNKYFVVYFGQTYGQSSYGACTYNDSTTCNSSTSGGGSTTGAGAASGAGGTLNNTGLMIALLMTIACLVVFVALVVRFWRRPRLAREVVPVNDQPPLPPAQNDEADDGLQDHQLR